MRLPPALAALVNAVEAIAGRAPSAQVTTARLDGIVRPGLLPARLRDGASEDIDAAYEQTATPIAGKDVEKLLKAAWGSAPGKVLDEIDLDDPVAVRPHAQVHRGVTEDGEAVAIKVMRPRLAEATRADLALLDGIAGPLSAAFPALDAGAFLREIRERVLDELDLEHEADVGRRAARGLRRVDGIEVAKVDGELTSHAVHVSTFLEGPTLADEDPEDPERTAELLLTAFLGAPRAIGLVLANPRADDVVLTKDGIGLIGPGAGRQSDAQRLDHGIAALEALQRGDRAAWTQALGDDGMQLLDAEAADDAYELIEEVLGPLLLQGPARLDDDALAAAGERALERLGDLVRLGTRTTPRPEDLWTGRMLGQLAAVLGRTGATAEWLPLSIAALKRGWER